MWRKRREWCLTEVSAPTTSAMTDPTRPTLHLSGEKLRAALEQLIAAAEPAGGIERFAGAVKLRAEIIQDRLRDGKVAALGRPAFDEIAVLFPTVRRRIGPLIESIGWPAAREAMAALLHEAHVPGTADQRVKRFEQALSHSVAPSPVAPRVLRDLAAELLHAVYPEHYPLMTRWVWDAGANTGTLREIWHDPASGSDDVDNVIIDVPDTHETFLVLREELSQFLADNGVFRDMIWYVDLILAQVYAIYINAQGGVYLKADFQADGDPLEHTRRILGLDRRAVGSRE